MTKKKAPGSDSKLTVSEHTNGAHYSFDVGPDSYYLRSPTIEEYNDASFEESLVLAELRTRARVQKLAEHPAAPEEIAIFKKAAELRMERMAEETDPALKDLLDERANSIFRAVENRDASQTLVTNRADQAKNTWLAHQLLVDKEGSPISFDDCDIKVQIAAVEATGNFLSEIESLPFD